MYTDKIKLLPKSIYNTSSDSNLSKLWGLFAQELEQIENEIVSWYDKESLEGITLDAIGKLKGIARNGLSDPDYRYELSLPRSLEIVTINAIYETAKFYGTKVNIRELHTPYLFDILQLDESLALDGNWLLDARIEPTIIYKLDETWLLDGSNVLESLNVRPMSLLLELETNSSFEYQKLAKEVEKLLAGVSVYYKFVVYETIPIDWDLLRTNLNGDWLLDSQRNLNTNLEVGLYNQTTELVRVTLEIENDTLRFHLPKRNYTVTQLRILRSGEVVYFLNVSIQTSIFMNYEFILN